MTQGRPTPASPTRRQLLTSLGFAASAGFLAGCQTRKPASASNAGSAAGATIPAPPTATQPQAAPVQGTQATFRFDPLIGVPADKADRLAAAIGEKARARGLPLVRRNDPTATYRVLGSLSAVGDNQGTTVSYVWDVLDTSNRRLRRISGFELSGDASGDPWSGVTTTTIDAIAARTVEALAAWINLQAPATTVQLDPSAGQQI
ncbi:hypothetical protein HDIA_3524 [Hartmannibacter diazotrophicus]|uniref:Lipoprotein n=1 Tax=Hartmannibacter diazotrophicus TaxID=1482074 RepID=A0A2C9DBT2_9HYPH|nr:hypothetical protein [Hartmannibacter diazotrophicus]SON57065.1 hypothetical protein HDIA_3524 [Hartmannibacter diazotrophicus]